MSNLYMTTEEFAAMIVDTLDDQNILKRVARIIQQTWRLILFLPLKLFRQQ